MGSGAVQRRMHALLQIDSEVRAPTFALAQAQYRPFVTSIAVKTV